MFYTGIESPIMLICDEIKKEYSQPLPAIPPEKREFIYSALRSSCLCCASAIALRRLMRYRRPVSASTTVTSRLTVPSCNRCFVRTLRFPFILTPLVFSILCFFLDAILLDFLFVSVVFALAYPFSFTAIVFVFAHCYRYNKLIIARAAMVSIDSRKLNQFDVVRYANILLFHFRYPLFKLSMNNTYKV